MFRLLALIALLSFGALPAKALSEMQGLVQFDCTQDCSLKCWGTAGNIDLTYRTLLVFQWKDHVRRLWIAVNNTQYVLGDDTSCRFEGTPRFKFQTSPLGPPPSQQCICIGGQCLPPGCSPQQ
jgi:hypothetical protein